MDLWVFGYGSLIWNPGIEVAETVRATLDGYHRSYCMWSIHHRGSEAEPGLVLALEPAPGAACEGVAIRAADPEPALAALRERELISSAYREEQVRLRAADGRAIEAITYVMDTSHPQYAAGLSLERQAEIIAHATGGRGPNHEYLSASVEALEGIGVRDPDLARLDAMVRRIRDRPA
ncbi:gamma-glutamylcyclotransferase [Jannaschia sp. Os4]|uniref:gamma-glutamylcyclotransferase n=1 Tax=Jannaschia sp. Os4 TaxID=2807617 RepID=UPI00193A4793|nr:gamma-glutamylcyclotransferase [Jannaschia sp. Os4]MBM2576166.1 gamma-glutamylcyclotransferase [Jannaschia sp. Os4]